MGPMVTILSKTTKTTTTIMKITRIQVASTVEQRAEEEEEEEEEEVGVEALATKTLRLPEAIPEMGVTRKAERSTLEATPEATP